MMFIERADETLLRGGIIAYPTEGVFGLGCLADYGDAIRVRGPGPRPARSGATCRPDRCGAIVPA